VDVVLARWQMGWSLVIAGACVLLPSLWWLMRVFKRARASSSL
jgi:hypothetical protein